jgi:uncharacterized protein YaaN involved in tellurite resistance
VGAVDWSQLSVGVAAVVALVYVTKVLRGMQRDVLSFMGNHMGNISSSLEATATNLASLNERVDRLHDDNVEQARTLAKADKTATRKVEEQNQSAVKGRVSKLEKSARATKAPA